MTDSSMNVVGSKTITDFIPAGKVFSRAATFSCTAWAVLKAFAPGSWKIASPIDGRPSTVAAVS